MSSSLLIDEPPLQVLPTLAIVLGLNEAIVLQQIHYWLNPRFNKNLHDGKLWVHNTYESWMKQFPFWGEKTIRRTISNLEERQVLISFISTKGFKKTKFYSIDYTRLTILQNEKMAQNSGAHPSGQNDQIDLPVWADGSGQSDQMRLVKVTGSYKEEETTTENTLSSPPTPQSDPDFKTDGEDEMRRINSDFEEEGSAPSPSKEAEISLREPPLSLKVNRGSPERKEGIHSKESEEQGRGALLPAQATGVSEPVLRASDLITPPTCLKPEGRFEDTPESLMLTLWNTIVQKELAGGEEGARPSVRLTLDRISSLKKIYQDLCDGDLSLWEKACRTIVSSSFLMGEVPNTKFKVSFDWMLRPANFLKIIEGGFTSGDRRLPASLSAADPLQPFLKAYEATPDLERVLSEIAALLGTSPFLNWFGKASFVLESRTLTILAPTRFIRDWIATHFLEDLRRGVKSVSSIDLKIEESAA